MLSKSECVEWLWIQKQVRRSTFYDPLPFNFIISNLEPYRCYKHAHTHTCVQHMLLNYFCCIIINSEPIIYQQFSKKTLFHLHRGRVSTVTLLGILFNVSGRYTRIRLKFCHILLSYKLWLTFSSTKLYTHFEPESYLPYFLMYPKGKAKFLIHIGNINNICWMRK